MGIEDCNFGSSEGIHVRRLDFNVVFAGFLCGCPYIMNIIWI